MKEIINLARIGPRVTPGDRRSIFDCIESIDWIYRARNAKANAKTGQVLPECRILRRCRNPVFQIGSKVALPVVHGNVSQCVRPAVCERIACGIGKTLRAGAHIGTGDRRTWRAVRVADSGVAAIPESVGHQDLKALATGKIVAAIHAGGGRPRSARIAAFEIFTNRFGGGAQGCSEIVNHAAVELIVKCSSASGIELSYARDERAIAEYTINCIAALVDSRKPHPCLVRHLGKGASNRSPRSKYA